jgi:hypothetical protein
MDIERAPKENLCLGVFAVLAVEHPEFRKTLGGLGVRGSEGSFGQIGRLPECFHCLRLPLAFETRRPQLPIASCQARAIRPAFGLLGPQDLGDTPLRLRVSTLLQLNIRQRVLRAGTQRTAWGDPKRSRRRLLRFPQFPLPPLRLFQVEQQLALPLLGMTPLGERQREMLLSLGPIVGIQVTLAFGSIQMTLPVPFLNVRFSPTGHTHGEAEDSCDADHNPLSLDRLGIE